MDPSTSGVGVTVPNGVVLAQALPVRTKPVGMAVSLHGACAATLETAMAQKKKMSQRFRCFTNAPFRGMTDVNVFADLRRFAGSQRLREQEPWGLNFGKTSLDWIASLET